MHKKRQLLSKKLKLFQPLSEKAKKSARGMIVELYKRLER